MFDNGPKAPKYRGNLDWRIIAKRYLDEFEKLT